MFEHSRKDWCKEIVLNVFQKRWNVFGAFCQISTIFAHQCEIFAQYVLNAVQIFPSVLCQHGFRNFLIFAQYYSVLRIYYLSIWAILLSALHQFSECFAQCFPNCAQRRSYLFWIFAQWLLGLWLCDYLISTNIGRVQTAAYQCSILFSTCPGPPIAQRIQLLSYLTNPQQPCRLILSKRSFKLLLNYVFSLFHPFNTWNGCISI